MATRFLTVRDPETDQVVKIEVTNDSVSAAAFAKVALTPTTPTSTDPNEKVPLRLYDPGFKNTAVCKSKISHIDPAGKLFYRGYDIEELFEKSTFLEVAFLLIYGELPTAEELTGWTKNIMKHTYVHSQLERQMLTFRYDAHPMGMMIATIASLSTFSPEANPAIVSHGMYMMPKSQNSDPDHLEMNDISLVIQNRNKVIYRALGKVPTISSAVYRHRLGRNYNHPMFGSLNYCENLLYMMDKLNEPNYKPDPRLVKILDKLFILIAEHGVTCSTGMLRHLASSGVDPYTALSGAAGALFGERKSAAVISMLSSLNSIEEIDEFLQSVKSSNCSDISAGNDPKNVKSKILMGFGHRIYNSFDPRVSLCKKLVEELFDLLGLTKNGKMGLILEEKVLNDDWFISRNLYPNIDFWLALAFDTLDFPSDMFPVWLYIPRVAGYLAHLVESLDDPEYKIFRPRQIYVGKSKRPYFDEAPTIECAGSVPILDSAEPKSVRPQYGASESLYDDLGNVNIFGDEGYQQSSLASMNKLRSWVQKRFKFVKSEDLSTEDHLSETRREIREMKEKTENLMHKLEKIYLNDNELSNHSRILSNSRNRTAEIDIMAGSQHSRVIAAKTKK